MIYFWRNFLNGLGLFEENLYKYFYLLQGGFCCPARLHFPGASIMKKSYILLTTCLIVYLYLLLAGCTLQESKTNTIKTDPTQTGKPNQSLFMPYINSYASDRK